MEYYKKQIGQSNMLISLLLGQLSKGDRKLMTICIIDLHLRDAVISKMILTKIDSNLSCESHAILYQKRRNVQQVFRWPAPLYEDFFVCLCVKILHFSALPSNVFLGALLVLFSVPFHVSFIPVVCFSVPSIHFPTFQLCWAEIALISTPPPIPPGKVPWRTFQVCGTILD